MKKYNNQSNPALNNRAMTPKELKIITGYTIEYVYTLARNKVLKSFKVGHSLLIDFDDAIKYMSQTKRDVKTGKVRRNKKPRLTGNIIKMFRKKLDTDSEAVAV